MKDFLKMLRLRKMKEAGFLVAPAPRSREEVLDDVCRQLSDEGMQGRIYAFWPHEGEDPNFASFPFGGGVPGHLTAIAAVTVALQNVEPENRQNALTYIVFNALQSLSRMGSQGGQS